MSFPAREIPAPLCGHPGGALVPRARTAACRVCGSFWDLDSLAADVRYDAAYCAARMHAEPRTGELKFRSLARWLDAERIDVKGRVVCEVGFGGGHVLPAEFLCWMAGSSSAHALALVVAPDAASPSARWLGRAWPHRLADHRFH